MRVLGVDPGLTRCGIGVIEGTPGGRLSLVAVGVIRTPSTQPLHHRLLTLQLELDEWLHAHDPDAIAVERMFARGDVATIMGTAQASAIPMLAAARRGLPLALHTPSEVKAAVTGNGRAEKAQVQEMVRRLLQLEERPKPADAADALALAICHLWRGGAADRLAEAGQVARQNDALEAARRAATPARNRWQEAVDAHRSRGGAVAAPAVQRRPRA